MALPKKLRLENTEISQFKQKKPYKYIKGTLFTLKYYNLDITKFFVLILKKHISTASSRNLLKRRLHSIIMNKYKNDEFKAGYYVFVSSTNINKNVTYEELVTEVDNFISKIS